MGNTDSLFSLDSCVDRRATKSAPPAPARGATLERRASASTLRTSEAPKTPKPDRDRTRSQPLLPKLAVAEKSERSAPTEEATPTERLRRLHFKTSKDDFKTQVAEERRRRALSKREVSATTAHAVAENESRSFLETFNRRPDIALTYGDVGGPGVKVDKEQVWSTHQDRVKERMQQAQAADRRRRVGTPLVGHAVQMR